MALPGRDLPGPVVPHQGPTRTWVPTTGAKPPPKASIRPQDGFIVAFGPIAGLTNPRALPGVFYFQVPPLDSFPTEFAWNWNDFGTVDSGMHSNPNYKQLTSITFDSMFVLEDGLTDHLVIASSQDSIFDRARRLKALGDSMTPFAVQVGSIHAWGEWEPLGPGNQQQMAATLRSFRYETRSGEPDTRYFTVSLTEFADAPALTKIAPPKMPGPGHRPAKTTKNGQKILATLAVDGLPPGKRTLAQLAKIYYGAVSGWRLIAKASGLTNVSANTDLYAKYAGRKPGIRLTIPARQTQTATKTKAKSG